MTAISRVLVISSLPLSLFLSSAALSQTLIIEDEPMVESGAVAEPIDPDANLLDGNSTRVIVPEHSGPAVRGWQGCGTYFFWDGERCVDARIAPDNR